MNAVPRPGDIGLVRIRGEVGRLIRVGQWLNGDGYADIEHAFVCVGDGQLVEAEPGGARLAALGEYGTAAVLWLRCPPEYGASVAAAARSLAGTPYSAADYLALAAHRLHLPVPGLKAYVADSHHLMCSQLADHAAALGGWHLFADGRWEGYVTPGAIRRLAEEQARGGIPA